MAKRVVPREALQLLNDGWTYVDVRSVPEFEQGHPAGAFNVPLLHLRAGRMAPNADFATQIEALFPKDAKIVLGCKSGPRSAQAAALLESLGYQNVVDVRGGFAGERDGFGRVSFSGWSDLGLPTANRAEPGRSFAEIETRAKTG